MILAAPAPQTGVDVWGQPPRAAEVAGRPLGSTLSLFHSGKTVKIATWHGLALAPVAKAMHAGRLVPGMARAVLGLVVVPTTAGGVCVQGDTFQTCHQGLLRQDVTYSFAYYGNLIVIFGIAADDVVHVSLGGTTTTVRNNVFTLSRPMPHSAHVPKSFGTLVIAYRGGRPSARVQLR